MSKEFTKFCPPRCHPSRDATVLSTGSVKRGRNRTHVKKEVPPPLPATGKRWNLGEHARFLIPFLSKAQLTRSCLPPSPPLQTWPLYSSEGTSDLGHPAVRQEQSRTQSSGQGARETVHQERRSEIAGNRVPGRKSASSKSCSLSGRCSASSQFPLGNEEGGKRGEARE